ncbi:MAG: hypothetical protein QM713_06170 [Arachnia sp.]
MNWIEVNRMRQLHRDSSWVGEDEVLDDEVVIVATRDELVLLANSLTEALEAVDEGEFATRLGGTSEDARSLRARVKDLLRFSLKPNQPYDG